MDFDLPLWWLEDSKHIFLKWWSTYLAGGSTELIDIDNMSRVKLDHFPKVETHIKNKITTYFW